MFNLGRYEKKINGVVLVSKGERILFEKAYGYEDMRKKTPMTEDSLFMLCSVSKTFVATAINQLQERGLLNKGSKIEIYFPEYFAGTGITIKHLLNQTSGIANYTMYKKEFEWTKDYLSDDLIRGMMKKGSQFKPGSKWGYSNTNYYILTMIIEKVTGTRYEDYVREAIFAPAGMTTATFASDYQGDFAKAHIKGKEGYQFATSLLLGAGDVICNSHDLLRFAQGLMNGTLIKKETFKEMMIRGCKKGKMVYGEGLFIFERDGEVAVGHSGSVPSGGATHLVMYPEKELVIITLLNNRVMVHPLIYPDANSKFIAGILEEQVMGKKLGLIKKGYL